MHIMCTNLQYANRAHLAPQTMQSSAVMSIKTPHALSNIANPSAASYLAPILHIDSAASSQTPSPNDGTSSIVAHQGQTGAKSCRAITIQLANASEKSPRDSVASCSASLRSLISNAQLITHRCSHTSHTSPRRTARHGAVSAHRGSVDRAAGADTQYLCQGAPATVQLQVMLPSRARSFAASLASERRERFALFLRWTQPRARTRPAGYHLGRTLGPTARRRR